MDPTPYELISATWATDTTSFVFSATLSIFKNKNFITITKEKEVVYKACKNLFEKKIKKKKSKRSYYSELFGKI